MKVQDLYNLLEKEVDAGNIDLESEIYIAYDMGFAMGDIHDYMCVDSDLILLE